MKILSVLTFSLLIAKSAMAADSAHVYACDHDLMVRLSAVQGQTKVDLRFPGTKGNIINVSSTKLVQTDHLQYVLLEQRETLNFAGFQYPKGGLYIQGEGETNEAGFTFSIDAAAADGAQVVRAASVYWGDFQKPDSTIYECVNVAD